MESAPPAPLLDFTDPSFQEDPFPAYHRLRQADPVHRTPLGSWVLTRHGDVTAVLTDERRFRKVPGHALAGFSEGPFRDYNANTLLFMDPPDYPRVRGTVAPAFSRGAVAGIESAVGDVVDDLMASLAGRETFDLMSEFASILPRRVMAALVGLDPAEVPRWARWSTVTSAALEPMACPHSRIEADRAAAELLPVMREVLARAAATGRGNLPALLAGAAARGTLPEEEAAANLMFLFSSGSETIQDLIGNGVHHLLSHPDVMDALRRHPEWMENAVEELLRLLPPVHLVHRFAIGTVEVGGRTIAAGDSVTLCLAAANRDPAVFPDPDRLDPARPARTNRHLAFGAGWRFCLGAALARIEGRTALAAILSRWPRLRAVAPPTRRPGIVFKGFARFEVAPDVAPT